MTLWAIFGLFLCDICEHLIIGEIWGKVETRRQACQQLLEKKAREQANCLTGSYLQKKIGVQGKARKGEKAECIWNM